MVNLNRSDDHDKYDVDCLDHCDCKRLFEEKDSMSMKLQGNGIYFEIKKIYRRAINSGGFS